MEERFPHRVKRRNKGFKEGGHVVFIKTWENSGWSQKTTRTLRDEAGKLSQLCRDLEATLNMWVLYSKRNRKLLNGFIHWGCGVC